MSDPGDQPKTAEGKSPRRRENLDAAQVFYVIVAIVLLVVAAGYVGSHVPVTTPALAQSYGFAAGGFAVAGFATPPQVVARAPAKAARSCILIYLLGGPPHQDMFDLKPRAPAEVRGPFRPMTGRCIT